MNIGIPFGQDKGSGEWRDVAEVSRGLACNCTCPSCKLPLSARHGDEREWHFAHHTRNIPKEEIAECEFSFEVSLRMMAHQLLREGVALKLPEYIQSVTVPLNLRGEIKPEVKIAAEQCLKPKDARLSVDGDFLGHKVDALYEFDTASLLVYFVYRGRKFPLTTKQLRDMRAGAILLDLEALAQLFYHLPMAEGGKLGTAKAQLLGWLQSGIEAKFWLYHPREDELLARKNAAIAQNLDLIKAGTSKARGRPTIAPHKLVKCHCLGCGKTFNGIRNYSNPCSNCNTHLYVVNP
jgi:hypothetical protein